MRSVLRSLALSLGLGALAAMSAPVTAAAVPGPPDLSGFQSVPVEPFRNGVLGGPPDSGEVYFQTPDGLLCAIRPAVGRAGCDGHLPGAPAAANEIVLAADPPSRGFRATATPQFVKPTGGAAEVLAVGHKISFADFECAVAEGPKTMCTKGAPVTDWLVIAEDGSGVGPRPAHLDARFPDPSAFIGSDDSYVVGTGPKNVFPVFTVANGLQCKMELFSGGTIACNGELPGADADEVFVALPGAVGTRPAADPPFSTPSYPGPVRQLPPGHRIDSYGATCMALEDGGVACLGAIGADAAQGFVVSAEDTVLVSPEGR